MRSPPQGMAKLSQLAAFKTRLEVVCGTLKRHPALIER